MRNDKVDPLDFWKKYSLLNCSSQMADLQLDKVSICRYCGLGLGETTFNDDTHLLPELLGKNAIHTLDECDACNHLFSGYESHLSIFIRPFLTLLGIEGKKGVPKFQSRSINGDRSTHTMLVHKSPGLRELFLGNDDDLAIDEEKGTISIFFRQPPYIPLSIYKAMVKIGLSLLPTHFDKHCRKIFEWLLNDKVKLGYINYGFITTMRNAYVRQPSAELYRAIHLRTKLEEFPEYTLVLRFANQVFQIFLPFTDELKGFHDRRKTLSIDLIPAMIYDVWKEETYYQIKPFEFSNPNSVVANQTIHFTYKEIEWNSKR